jgi:hypothetical protein
MRALWQCDELWTSRAVPRLREISKWTHIGSGMNIVGALSTPEVTGPVACR